MAAKGLVTPRQSTPIQAVMLGTFVERYIASRIDVSARTRVIYGNVQANLLAHFGAEKSLKAITPGDVDQFRLFMVGKGYEDATVRRRLGISKQFFTSAMRSKLIESNPFDGQKVQVKGSEKRFRFVTLEEYRAVLAVCLSTEWRVLLTLARIGGVRVPSETTGLRWTDIDWQGGKVTIRSPKTAHHGDGHAERQIPLFPEHVVAKWVGHNQVTARGFYLKVLPSDFERAAGWSAEQHQSRTTPASEAAQKAAQSEAVLPGSDQKDGQGSEGENPVLRGITACCNSLQEKQLRPAGLGPATSGFEAQHSIQLSYGRMRSLDNAILESPPCVKPVVG